MISLSLASSCGREGLIQKLLPRPVQGNGVVAALTDVNTDENINEFMFFDQR